MTSRLDLPHGYRIEVDQFGRPWVLSPESRPLMFTMNQPSNPKERHLYTAAVVLVVNQDMDKRAEAA